jgi:aryl-alcohol dehydrogenase-like predicted oxidoreductase
MSAQVALAFVLSNDQVGAAVFGTTRLQHLDGNIAARSLTLPDLLVKQIGSVDHFKRDSKPGREA